MGRPHALFRTGFPYLKTIGMRRVTSYAIDVAVTDDDRLFVLCRGDTTAEVRRTDMDDVDHGSFGGRGTAEGKFTWPASLAVGPDGNLYISDEALNRISIFSLDGEFISCWGSPGSGEGQLDRPSGLRFDGDGDLYLSDTMNHRVQKFSKDGEFLQSWGSHGDGDGELNMPWGVDVDELGAVYVSDWRNDRIQKFGPDGQFEFAVGSSGNGRGQFDRPTGIAVDGDGDIYVSDWGNDRVQQFAADGRYLDTFIGDATMSKCGIDYVLANPVPLRLREMTSLEPQKRFRGPLGLATDERKRLFVADYGAFRVQIYQKQAIELSADQIAPERQSPSLSVT
ncbi:MAG: hypothetical protein F4Z40_05270 [Chloroflexi bacterium]|nr:hypothetical protein [Chloroflexota bacterium]